MQNNSNSNSNSNFFDATDLFKIPEQLNIPDGLCSAGDFSKEGANKQVISSQADSLIKISRIWA
ncbi:hypothetical protein ACOY9X_28325, partial [Citrobacter freundii complex sp. 2024EL-00748]